MRFFAGVLCLAGWLACAGCTNATEDRTPEVSSNATIPFSLPDLNGNAVSLSGLKGQVVLLDFWATWCGPCRLSIPVVQRIHERHKGSNLRVLGLNLGESRETAQAFAQSAGITYTILLDSEQETAADYGIEGIPRFFLLDKNGRIAHSVSGYSDGLEDELESAITQLLQQP